MLADAKSRTCIVKTDRVRVAAPFSASVRTKPIAAASSLNAGRKLGFDSSVSYLRFLMFNDASPRRLGPSRWARR